MVTPVHYTTVTWFIDDEQVAEGLTIDVPVLAGDHIVKIVAKTTKGLETSRTCQLIVQPAEGDPSLAGDNKSRWLTTGTTKTVECENVNSVSKVFIGKTEATNVSYADGKLTFNVPAMAEKDYLVTIEADGQRDGCGYFHVSDEAYVDPGIKETVLWEGGVDINWGDNAEDQVVPQFDLTSETPMPFSFTYTEANKGYRQRARGYAHRGLWLQID